MKKPLPVFLLAATVVVASAAIAMACRVPVFRYALERWSADTYQVIVLSSGPLDATSQTNLQRLQSAEAEHEANFELATADVATIHDAGLLELWQQHQPNDSPLMIVLYPRTAVVQSYKTHGLTSTGSHGPLSHHQASYTLRSSGRLQLLNGCAHKAAHLALILIKGVSGQVNAESVFLAFQAHFFRPFPHTGDICVYVFAITT